MGKYAGGIAGKRAGHKSGIANVTYCHSHGNIHGHGAGGIYGEAPGYIRGTVHVTRSHSTGDILKTATTSGGIVGTNSGRHNSHCVIRECYHSGGILADRSGGICGAYAASQEGEMHIADCYSVGNIDGDEAGGITGKNAGGTCGTAPGCLYPTGNVYIKNAYASGTVTNDNAGGLIGSILSEFTGEIKVLYSVYNAQTIVGDDSANHLNPNTTKHTSANLSDIRGQLYHASDGTQWSSETWKVNAGNELPLCTFSQAKHP